MNKNYEVEDYLVAGAAVAFGAYLGMEGAKAAFKTCNTILDKATEKCKKRKSKKPEKTND